MSKKITRRTAWKIAAGIALGTAVGGAYLAFRPTHGPPKGPSMDEPTIPRTAEDLCFLPAIDLARLIRAKKLSPSEVVKTVLARIDALNSKPNAYCTIDQKGATTTAKRIEQEIQNDHNLE